MMRWLPTFLFVSVAAGCTFTPPGECQSAADCVFGARCETGVCVLGCDADEHCAGDWERCDPSNRRCAVREGRCSSQAQCESWEECGVGHTCQTSANFCAAETDCADHEDCNLSTHLCQVQAGRCNSFEDCGSGATPWAACDSGNYCTYAPTDDVMMWGTLSEGACYRDAISPVESPERAKVGFGCYTGIFSNAYAILMPSGAVLYFESDTSTDNKLRIFTPDRFTWKEDSGYWEYPLDPYANDQLVPTPGCGAGGAYSAVVQAVTSRVAYSCSGNAANWYDSAGNLLVTGNIRAWNRDGLFLRGSANLELVDAAGAVTAVTGLPSTNIVDARAEGSGFWIALAPAPDQAPELWRVDAAGVATRQVVYADPPSGVNAGSYSGVLSRSGALYQEVGVANRGDTVLRRSPDGSTAEIVYAEGDMPEGSNDTSERTLRLYTLMHISYLFAGP